MKFIEIEAHGKTFLINPNQILYVEGRSGDENPLIRLIFCGSNGEAAVDLSFQGEVALELWEQLYKE